MKTLIIQDLIKQCKEIQDEIQTKLLNKKIKSEKKILTILDKKERQLFEIERVVNVMKDIKNKII